VGEQTFGKDYLLRITPVTHDWQLLVAAVTISVQGTNIAEGIIPDDNLK
jgi:hypothetical protein